MLFSPKECECEKKVQLYIYHHDIDMSEKIKKEKKLKNSTGHVMMSSEISYNLCRIAFSNGHQ